MPLYPALMFPIPYFWSFYGHSYYKGNFGVHGPAGRADSVVRSLFGLDQQQSSKNHAVVGAKLTWNGLSQGGWTRLGRNELGNITNPGYPDIAYDGSFFLGWGINDLGTNGNTVQMNTAYQHAMRFAISRCRAARTFDPSVTTGVGGFTYGTGLTAVTFAWETSTGDTYRTATVTTSSTISWTVPADYHGGPIVFCFLAKCGVLGASWTWGGTAGVTGSTSTSNIMPAAAGTAQNTGGRCPVVRRITNLTSANASQTITLTVASIDSTGSADFAGAWIESPYPPPVLVANAARMNALGYANYTFTYASSLTGTAVTSTPATITLASGTTYGLPTAGSATCPSAGGTVTISWTGGPGSTLNTLTGVTTSGGSGNYSSSTLTYVGPSDADVTAFNTYLTSVVAEFDGMVQVVDLDTAISKDPLALGTDGLHPSELGAARIADAFRISVQKLAVSSPYGEASQMNPPNRSLVPMVLPRVSTGWYTTPGVTVGGTAYTAVAGDLFAIPMTVTSQGEVWQRWSVETLAGTVAATVMFAIYDDCSTTGLPKHIYNNPCTGPVTMPVGAGVFNSVTSAGNGFLVAGPDPGLYWLVLLIVAAGTGVTFRTNKGPTPLMPPLTTGGGGASTTCGWKATGQGTTFPASWPFPFTPGLDVMSDNCPMIGVQIL
jgi:hypothetical protein